MNALIPLNVTTAQDFRNWLADEGDHLIAAVQLFGGAHWAKRAAGIVASARSGGPLPARDNTLTALRNLLHGSHSHSIDGLDPFTWLHPDDPRAINAMRCADALDYGLSALDAQRRRGQNTGLTEKDCRMD